MTEQIKEIWSANREVYGRPRIHAELQAAGERIGAKRVGRLMRRAGIAGASRRRSTKTTTRDQRAARAAPDREGGQLAAPSGALNELLGCPFLVAVGPA